MKIAIAFEDLAEQRYQRIKNVTLWALITVILATAIVCINSCTLPIPANVQTPPATEGTASYYTYQSCIKEGTSGIMANGRRFDDTKYTFACWMFPFGTRIKFTNLDNNKSIVAVCTDRGPSKRLIKRGRLFDLSKATFAKIENLDKGIIKIKWKIIK